MRRTGSWASLNWANRTFECPTASLAKRLLMDRRAPEYPGHGPDTRTLQMQACNGQTLFTLKLLVLSSFVYRNTLYETGVALHV